ncbi:hypothetical protein ILUMI_01357 [Ignelater luminosus]|uniref:Uncharacterized protein n=1 Tax=Ignelater luminosus TaxID=2038154 RepID=A0A8K0DK86_IGNLU|nr:hypothetical protein ILUMI_01357 [Ignelater luminosus]
MANIPNRNLDLSIIDHPKVTLASKEDLENINPNRDFGKNTLAHIKNLNGSTNIGKRVKDGRDLKIMAHDHNTDNNQYLQKSDCFEIKDFGSDLTKTGQTAVKAGLLQENNIIDLYNYKRDNYSTTSRYHYNLDNAKLCGVKNDEQCQDNKQKPASYMYDSFDSHGCETNKHQCGCFNNKELFKNTRSNAAIQTEMESVQSNSLENSNDVHKNSDDPTVKDLLKIIHQQNDQLLILQKQVAALLNSREIPKQIEAQSPTNRNVNIFGEKCRTSTQLESQGLYNPLQNCHVRKGPLPQFSLDVMTSFEVSIRRQQNLNRAYKDSINHQPKICEVSESDSNAFNHSYIEAGTPNGICNKKNTDNTEVSLTLNEPVHVPETCPSPVNTVRIDMEDYSSDDEEINPDEQWFYKNVKGQVNQILRKSGIWPSNNSSSSPPEDSNNILTCSIRKKVKEATIKHLKSIGVHVPTLDDTDDAIEMEHPNNVGYSPNDVSFAVKQLLMKYLPNEQLAKLAHMQTQKTASPQLAEQAGLIKRRPEFSFATVQYMQKYNLLSDNSKPNNQPQAVPVIRQDDHFDRILDITAIRQQPKLL